MLRAEGLTKRFRTAGRTVTPLDGVDLTLRPGARVGLTGPSGCGKSTLARCLSLLLAPDDGSMTVDDRPVERFGVRAPRELRRQVQLLWQSPRGAADPRQRLRTLVGEPATLFGGSAQEAVARWAPVVGLTEELLDRHPHEVSEGQLQRAMIARCLACEPRYVIADEPTSMLDVSSQAAVLDAISTAALETGLGVLLITHNTVLAEYWCEEVRSFADLRSRP